MNGEPFYAFSILSRSAGEAEKLRVRNLGIFQRKRPPPNVLPSRNRFDPLLNDLFKLCLYYHIARVLSMPFLHFVDIC